MEIEMIPCPICGNPFPKLRKTKFGYNFCVNCSTIGTKKCLSVQLGDKDNTYDEIIIVEDTQYKNYTNQFESSDRDDELEENGNQD